MRLTYGRIDLYGYVCHRMYTMMASSLLHPGIPSEAFTTREVLAEAPPAPLFEQSTLNLHPDTEIRPNPPVEQRSSIRARLASGVAGVALTGYLLLDGTRPAEAAQPATIAAETLPQSPGVGWGNIFAGLGLAVTAIAIIRQTNEKTADRFYAALQGIKGESTGEERLARLNALAPFAARRKYAPEVLRASVVYLRGRRGGLVKLRQEYKDKPDELDNALTERRNADRSALKLFLETLPRVRRQTHRQNLAKRIAMSTKIINRGSDERELQRIGELTDIQMDTEKPRVDARGINLDDMRGGVRNCNLRGVDLTGAGLQRNDIRLVSFRDARLCEAQFEGSQLSNCGIQGADFRAAYFGNTDYAVFENCLIDADTRFGNLPDKHPDAKMGMLNSARAEEYRGIPNVILKDLRSDTLSHEEIIQVVHEWQRNGLVLKPGSNPEYFLNP